jgi:NAD(P)H-dependent nitrite reductase small subunit
MPWVAAARLEDLSERRGRRVRLGDKDIALWRVNGRVYAIGNVCPHQHTALLFQGTLTGLAVTCPMHGWTFSLETGRAVEGSGRVQTYPVEVHDGMVMVESGDGSE